MRIPRLNSTRLFIASSVIAVIALSGCTDYYKVTDPSSNRVYYSTDVQKREGAVSLRDAASGNTVTIQNSEVAKISEQEFTSHRALSGRVPPEQAAAPKQGAGASEAALAGASVAGGAAIAASPTITPAQFRENLLQGRNQVDKTLSSLSSLANPNQTNVPVALQSYSAELTKMDQYAQRTRAEAEAMQQQRSQYFIKWEQKAAETDNATIRAAAEAQRDRLRAANERITTAAGQTRDSYQAFMAELRDVQKFVAKEPNRESITVLGPSVTKAQQDGQQVKQRIDDLIVELDAVEGITSGAPARPPTPTPAPTGAGTPPPPPPAPGGGGTPAPPR
jgi:hypothetical protein